ncbi:hypothetical protein P355_4784 [Burkholderia cenocepacia KC-01]|nr:hypothetical protein P355_4784 [Burkholderia cenocepacia KC-01]
MMRHDAAFCTPLHSQSAPIDMQGATGTTADSSEVKVSGAPESSPSYCRTTMVRRAVAPACVFRPRRCRQRFLAHIGRHPHFWGCRRRAVRLRWSTRRRGPDITRTIEQACRCVSIAVSVRTVG